MAVDFETIAKQFVEFYFNTFDADRAQLANLYRDDSMLTFEATPVGGVAGIVEKLQNLPFQQVKHRTDTIDAQPADLVTGSILVLVTGALQVEGQDKPMSFTQAFQLKPIDGSYYIFNDVFRLVYPAS